MARNRRRTLDHLRFPLLAGWLFADLFVVLFIISLASGASTPPSHRAVPPRPTATPAAKATPSPKPKQSLKPTPSQSGVLQNTPTVINVPVSPAELQELYADPGNDSQLVNGLLGLMTSGEKAERAGFVQLFLPGTDSGEATTIATEIVGDLPRQDPAMFAGAVTQGLWHGDSSTAEFQIFFVALSVPPVRAISKQERNNRPFAVMISTIPNRPIPNRPRFIAVNGRQRAAILWPAGCVGRARRRE
jgi:hypothetical protein